MQMVALQHAFLLPLPCPPPLSLPPPPSRSLSAKGVIQRQTYHLPVYGSIGAVGGGITGRGGGGGLQGVL